MQICVITILTWQGQEDGKSYLAYKDGEKCKQEQSGRTLSEAEPKAGSGRPEELKSVKMSYPEHRSKTQGVLM